MAKIVKYFNNQNIVDYIMGFDHRAVVKVTLANLSDCITSEFVKPLRATAYLISRRNFVVDSLIEGEIVRCPMIRNSKGAVQNAIESLEKFLNTAKGQFEVIFFLKSQSFGIAIVDYFSPENWYN